MPIIAQPAPQVNWVLLPNQSINQSINQSTLSDPPTHKEGSEGQPIPAYNTGFASSDPANPIIPCQPATPIVLPTFPTRCDLKESLDRRGKNIVSSTSRHSTDRGSCPPQRHPAPGSTTSAVPTSPWVFVPYRHRGSLLVRSSRLGAPMPP